MAVPPPLIPLLPPAPSRSEGQASFNATAEPFVAALPPMVVNVNASLTWVGQQVTAIDGYRQAAAQSASDAAGSASSANTSKNAAAQSASDATTNGAAQVTLANQARNSAQAAAAAAASAAGLPSLAGNAGKSLVVNATANGVEWGQGLPSMTGNARKPLAPNAGATASIWSDELSIPKYLDKLFYGVPTAAYALDLALYSVFNLSLTVNTTLSITNKPTLAATESLTIVVRVVQNASAKTLTWFGDIFWLTPGAVAPDTPAASKTVEYILSTPGSNGFSWVGRVGGAT